MQINTDITNGEALHSQTDAATLLGVEGKKVLVSRVNAELQPVTGKYKARSRFASGWHSQPLRFVVWPVYE